MYYVGNFKLFRHLLILLFNEIMIFLTKIDLSKKNYNNQCS